MKDKIGVLTGIMIVLIASVTLIVYIINADDISVGEILTMIIVFVLVTSASYIVWDRLKNIKKGLPAKDERLVLTNYRASYYGFIAAIWSSIIGNIASDTLFNYELTGSELAGIVVLSSGLVFIFSYLYFSFRGT